MNNYLYLYIVLMHILIGIVCYLMNVYLYPKNSRIKNFSWSILSGIFTPITLILMVFNGVNLLRRENNEKNHRN